MQANKTASTRNQYPAITHANLLCVCKNTICLLLCGYQKSRSVAALVTVKMKITKYLIDE
jgi:hypothetical protein